MLVGTSTTRTVTISGNDYSTNFTLNGNATILGDTATLTEDKNDQVGNTILNNKIDMSQSFTLKGRVNLGDKSQKQMGADGIGFVFQPGDTHILGTLGAGVGFGGIKDAFGFKLDTFYNGYVSNSASIDPVEYGPKHGQGEAFGAFVDGTSGIANTIDAGSQSISEPKNNEFKDIIVSYDGTSKVMNISYDGKTWTKNISALVGNNTSMSFAISSATGTHTNLQQFQLISFNYTVAQGKVFADYIDENGNPIADELIQKGDLKTDWSTSQKVIPGYTYKTTKGTTSGVYTADDQFVSYIYNRNQGKFDITYIDDTTSRTLDTKDFSGGVGDLVDYSTIDAIKSYQDYGYELVSDGFSHQPVFYDSKDQHFQIHLKYKIITVNPENPEIPNTPINQKYQMDQCDQMVRTKISYQKQLQRLFIICIKMVR